jgi:hypothetical protein
MDACLRSRAGRISCQADGVLAGSRPFALAGRRGLERGVCGQYQVPPDIDTPIGHAFALSEPVAISDYFSEKTYRYPTILKDHGCVASLNVPLRTDRGNFGVLEVDHTSSRTFSADDIYFLTGLGNTVAAAVELRRALQAMEAALDEKQLLVREMNHRSRTTSASSAPCCRCRPSAFRNPASDRQRGADSQSGAGPRPASAVHLIGNAGGRSSSVTQVDAASHFQELCAMLRSLLPAGVALTPRCSGSIPSDCVESLTLIANELVTMPPNTLLRGATAGRSCSATARRAPAGGSMSTTTDAGCLPTTTAVRESPSDGCF